MGTPITWQNVTGPSLAQAGIPLESAQKSFTSASDIFNNLIKKQEDTDKANWEQGKINTTENLLNKIAAAKTVNDFNALQQSGQIENEMANAGAQVDRAAIRNALDGRLTTLQGRDKEAWAFQNALLTHQDEPKVNEAKGLLAQGKVEQAKGIIASLSPQGQAQMYGEADARERLQIDRMRQDKEFNWKTERHPLEIAQLNAQIAASNASTANNIQNTKFAKEDHDRTTLANTNATAMVNNVYRNGGLTSGNIALIMDEARKLNVAAGSSQNEHLQSITQKLSQMANDGVEINVVDKDGSHKVRVPIPFDVARAAVLGSQNEAMDYTLGIGKWNSGYGRSTENNINTALEKLKVFAQKTEKDGTTTIADSPLARDYSQYLGLSQYGVNPAKAGALGSNNVNATSSGSGSGKGGGKK